MGPQHTVGVDDDTCRAADATATTTATLATTTAALLPAATTLLPAATALHAAAATLHALAVNDSARQREQAHQSHREACRDAHTPPRAARTEGASHESGSR